MAQDFLAVSDMSSSSWSGSQVHQKVITDYYTIWPLLHQHMLQVILCCSSHGLLLGDIYDYFCPL